MFSAHIRDGGHGIDYHDKQSRQYNISICWVVYVKTRFDDINRCGSNFVFANFFHIIMN